MSRPIFDMTKDVNDNDEIVQDQIRYYRDRAPEYDEWHLRSGRYDRGDEHRKNWFSELEVIRSALVSAVPTGRVLEIACGTGLWTSLLADTATRLTAIDASIEAIEINRAKLGSKPVEYVVADIFNWKPDKQYDFIFFGFWISHIPRELFEPFWTMVCSALTPDGRVFFVDSLATQNSTAKDHDAISPTGFVNRKLNNGAAYRIVKEFYIPQELEGRLRDLGWTGRVDSTKEFFFYGLMTRGCTTS